MILASLAGWSLNLAFAPYDQPWLAPAVVAWLIGLLMTETGAWRGCLIGLGFGVGLYAPGLAWIFSSVSAAHVPWLAVLGPALLIGVFIAFPAGVGAIVVASRAPVGVRTLLLFPSLWLLSEWFRHQTSVAMPAFILGYSQVPNGPLLGFAPLGGVLGVSLATLIGGGLLYLIVASKTTIGKLGAAAAIVTLSVLATLSNGVVWTTPVGAPIQVALLQGNLPLAEKFDPAKVAEALRTYVRLAQSTPAPLVIMPETAIPLFQSELPRGFDELLRRLGRDRHGDIVVSHFRRATDRNSIYFSSVRSLGVSGDQTYDKRHLMPFAEFVPLEMLLRPIYELIAQVPHFDTSAGRADQDSLILGGHRVALRMCFEDLFGDQYRDEVASAGFIVGIVNDSWDDSLAPMDQHLRISQMRALESGKPMVRAANTGWTAAIDAAGSVVARAPRQATAALEVSVQPRTGVTPYVRFGDAVALGFASIMLLLAALAEISGRVEARMGAAR